MQKAFIYGLIATVLTPLHSSTLLQLSLDDLIRKSTSIVRGKVQPTTVSAHGSINYSHYSVQVSETLKGSGNSAVDLSVPGGVVKGLRQSYSGAPSLVTGQDYVIFLWTSKTGVTQVIGLSQGLFAVINDASGQPAVVRAATTERMLNGNGQQVADSDIQMPLAALRTRIQQVLSAKAGQ